MSIASGDINNDLVPEIYAGQITGMHGKEKGKYRDAGPDICGEIADPGHSKSCREIMTVHQRMPSQTKKQDVFACLSKDVEEYREDCIAHSLLLWALQNGPQKLCDLFPDRWATFRFICHEGFSGAPERRAGNSRRNGGPGARKGDDGQAIPVVLGQNVLLMAGPDGRFADKASEMGVQEAGFTWNAKFADLDNDEFLDLYIVNGWFPGPQRDSSFFYQNQQGGKFADRTEEAGLKSFLATSAYTYIDLDNDGDLDIVSVPISGPVLVYINNSKKNRIAFELRDHAGNRFGIGSRIIVHYGPGGARHQMREIQASGGFISFDAPIAYFGLGEFERVERVEVLWSTGERSDIRGDFPAGARYIVNRQRIGNVQQTQAGK
jgi:hypothetical protein